MKTIKFIGQLVVVLGVIAYVRISRAVEAALWEICPEVVTGFRNIADSAHREVCAEQKRAIAFARAADEPAPAPAYAEVLTPPPAAEELPPTGPFESMAEWENAVDAHKRRSDKLADLRRLEVYGTMPYISLSNDLDRNSRAWDRCIKAVPRPPVYA